MDKSKANDFLNILDSDVDEISNYGSDDDLKKGGRGAKRRKISGDDEQASDDEGDDDNKDESDSDDDDKDEKKAQDEREPENPKPKSKGQVGLPKIDRPLTKKNLVATEAAVKKSGVVYISRTPPFMKPNKLRSLLAPYGEINRIFLAPEDPAARARRIKGGGNKRKTFTEGWVEFLDKKRAKAVCELLNARPMGGKKGSYYRDDIWNLLYLKGFKWHNLTEQIAAEDAERSSRMRAEISKSTRENKLFVRNIERGKMIQGMETKAKKRKAPESVGDGEKGKESARTFRQVAQVNKDQDAGEQPEHVARVLGKIF